MRLKSAWSRPTEGRHWSATIGGDAETDQAPAPGRKLPFARTHRHSLSTDVPPSVHLIRQPYEPVLAEPKEGSELDLKEELVGLGEAAAVAARALDRWRGHRRRQRRSSWPVSSLCLEPLLVQIARCQRLVNALRNHRYLRRRGCHRGTRKADRRLSPTAPD